MITVPIKSLTDAPITQILAQELVQDPALKQLEEGVWQTQFGR
jgi:hypothetical protein